jgi:hypothetical protein
MCTLRRPRCGVSATGTAPAGRPGVCINRSPSLTAGTSCPVIDPLGVNVGTFLVMVGGVALIASP